MPFRASIENAEVMKNEVRETKIGPISRLMVKTWNPTKKGSPPAEMVVQTTVFSPGDMVLNLANGDKVNIKGIAKYDSNPNIVQVRKAELEAFSGKLPQTYDSRFIEITCRGEEVELIEKRDKTRTNTEENLDDNLLF